MNIIESLRNPSNIVFIDKYVKSSRFFHLFSNNKLTILGSYIEKQIFREPTIIKAAGVSKLTAYIYVLEGNLRKIKNGVCEATYGPNTLIMEDEVFLKSDTSDFSLETDPNCRICTLISLRAEVIECNLSHHVHQFIKGVFEIEHSNYSLNNCQLISHLGQGSYGCVNLIKQNSKFFALKSVFKEKIGSEIRNYLDQEEMNLKSLVSPFALKLYFKYEDENFFHFITEFIEGVPLNEAIDRKLTARNEKLCLHFASTLLLTLEHLKAKCIVHRDIKPGNIIIDGDGILKLIDFGLSKKVKDYTYTIIGSPFFMAPEVLKGQGYSHSCDYWSVGITLYKTYYNKYPFGDKSQSPLHVYNSIIQESFYFPSCFNQKNSNIMNKLIKLLLTKEVATRPIKLDNYEECIGAPIEVSQLYNASYFKPQVQSWDMKFKSFFNKKDEIKQPKDYEGVTYNSSHILRFFN